VPIFFLFSPLDVVWMVSVAALAVLFAMPKPLSPKMKEFDKRWPLKGVIDVPDFYPLQGDQDEYLES
jgi:hypothetical protein